MTDKLILLMYQSWLDLDAAVEGLTAEEAEARHGGASRIAWTVGHVTHMLDSWINTRFQKLPAHPLISDDMFRTGASGDSPGWPAVSAGVREVREAARHFLDSSPGPDLERTIPYDGSIAFLRPAGLSLRYALMRISAHHFMHAGEIRTIRSGLGHTFSESPDWGRILV